MRHPILSRRAVLRSCGAAGLLLTSSVLAACGGSATTATTAASSTSPATTAARTPTATAAARTAVTATTSSAVPRTSSASATTTATVSASSARVGTGAKVVSVMHFWGGVNATDFQNILNQYPKTHPGVTLQVTAASGKVEEKLITLVSAGDPPDLSHIWAQDIGSMAHLGVPQKLTAYIGASKFDLKALVPAQVAMGTLAGQVFALPWTANVYGLLWDKALFAQAGLDQNTPPKTIEELTSMGTRLTKQAGDQYTQLGMLPAYPWSLIDLWTAVFGGSAYDEKTGKLTANNPGTVRALQWEQQVYGQLGPTKVTTALKSWQSGWNTKVSGPLDAPFQAEHMAFYLIGEWAPGGIQKAIAQHAISAFDFGAAPIPYPADRADLADTSVLLNCNMWCLPTGAKNADGGWGVLSWLEMPGPTLQAVETIQNLPPLLHLDLGTFGSQHPQFAEFITIAKSAKLQYRPVIPIQSEFWGAISKVESDVIAGKVSDIAGALAQVDATMQPKLEAALKA